MEQNIILAGVGGQGILTIAQAISLAALRRGWNVKQSEVHGMSQRGGAVQSHVRIADHPLHSDLVPLGRADLVLSVEPVEALRYPEYLARSGVILSSINPFVNIPNYPPLEDVLRRIREFGAHLLIDADHWASKAGSTRASNVVMLGAASLLLDLSLNELSDVLSQMFAAKGKTVVELNQRALRLGRTAAAAYRDALHRGMIPAEVAAWVKQLPIQPAAAEAVATPMQTAPLPCGLSLEQARRCDEALAAAARMKRKRLFEQEVYALVQAAGAIVPPRHVFIPRGEAIDEGRLELLGGSRVVLKLVSTDVVHKTESGAVAFVPRDVMLVNHEIGRLVSAATARGHSAEGVLVVECVEHGGTSLGNELFVGMRATREFGPVIAAGLGGTDTEYLASRMKPGIAVAKALAMETTAERFLDLFKATAAYELLSGDARGRTRAVDNGDLLRVFAAFLAMARRYAAARADGGPELVELEVNPFAVRHGQLVPLDGRGMLGRAIPSRSPRNAAQLASLLTPRSIAVMGVSSKRANFGRIILNNIVECGFPPRHLHVIKDQAEPIDGIACVSSLKELPETVDLLVTATAATELPGIIGDVIATRRARGVILIPGGLGEKEGTQDLQQRLQEMIADARANGAEGPIFLGGNCMGVRSRPGNYDTFFIPRYKLDPRRDATPRRLALISQSGAFVITRMSNVQSLDPMLAVSAGNQIDVTISDLVGAVATRDDIDCIGVYVEGFNDMDGLAFVRAVEAATAAGKVVVFYKAGRTAEGRGAAAGHTASLAGDYEVCQSAAAQAGAIVTDTFKEFEQLLEIATTLHDKPVRGLRLAAVSNAGYEAVGLADAIVGARYQLQIARLTVDTHDRLERALSDAGLGTLVNVRNPLDLTPMADDAAYEACLRLMLESDEVDAAVVGIVPMTPQLKTLANEINAADSIAARLARVMRDTAKPLVAVVDSGPPFDPLTDALRRAGLPVFRTADQAIRSLGRYLCHRGRLGEFAARRPQSSESTSERRVPCPMS